MKKVVKAGLAGLLITASLSACTGKTESSNNADNVLKVDSNGKYTEPVEVSIGKGIDANYKFEGNDTAENNAYTRWLKDRYNIDIKHEWEASAGDYEQKVSLTIASNDLPDAMLVNESQLKQMIKADQLADLSEVYEEYGSERLKDIYKSNPGLLDNVTVDGKLYAFPETTLPSAPMTWIRKDWLDKLGLQPPKNLQDVENIAQAFIDNNMGGQDTIGIVGTAQGGALYPTFLTSGDHSFNLAPVFFANNAYPGIWVKDEDGKAVYGSTLPETKATLALLNEWYKEGILDKELGLRKSSQEVIASGKTGIYFGAWWTPYNIEDSIKNDPNANWRPYAAPVDAAGVLNSNETTGSQYIVVSKEYEHPEAIVELLNIHVNEKDPSYKEAVGKEMTSQEIPLFTIMGHGDQLKYAVDTTRKFLAGEISLEEVDKVNYGFTYELVSHAKNTKKEPYDNYDIQYWNKDDEFFTHVYSHLNGGSTFVDADINYVRSLATAKTQTMQTRWTNLKKLEDETFLKIIFGNAPLSDFDKFVEQWKEQGGEQITKEVNEQ